MNKLRKYFDTLGSVFAKRKVEPGCCTTKFPLILVHGIAIRDNMIFSSWGRVPEYLRRGGAQVFLSDVDAWASSEQNAQKLKIRIEHILQQTNSEKVNLIAHSKGGLDSRYAISKLHLAEKVASLTTISTPHRGCCIADIVTRAIPQSDNIVYKLTNFIGKLMGDTSPAASVAVKELSRVHMKKFNEEIKDEPQVYYQSYGARMFQPWNDPIFAITFPIVTEHEGENDGMVSIQSCQWGDFKGIVEGNKPNIGISHFVVTGAMLDKFSGINIPMQYVNWVEELKLKGF